MEWNVNSLSAFGMIWAFFEKRGVSVLVLRLA